MLTEWLAFRPTFLDELLRWDGRGLNTDHVCARCQEAATAMFRCIECFGTPMLCKECLLQMHKHSPFHAVKVRIGHLIIG